MDLNDILRSCMELEQSLQEQPSPRLVFPLGFPLGYPPMDIRPTSLFDLPTNISEFGRVTPSTWELPESPMQTRGQGRRSPTFRRETSSTGSKNSRGEEDEDELSKFREESKQKIRLLRQQMSDDPKANFKLTSLNNYGSTVTIYRDISDKVLRNIQPMHNWYPVISKIDKVTNLELEIKFEEAKQEAFGTHIAQKFHGTGHAGVENIPMNGFRMPGPPAPGKQPGMFGQGIYFASDSSKSAQEIYTKGSRSILLCDVLVGNAKLVVKADTSLCKDRLRREQFDSVFAPRDSKSSGGVQNDEYVIFDPRQAIVRYIIHYSNGGHDLKANLLTLDSLAKRKSGEQVLKKNIKLGRMCNVDDPFEQRFMIAEAHFKKMTGTMGTSHQNTTREIESIDIVFNKTLEDQFRDKKEEFKRHGVNSNEVLAFHGTSSKNIDSILRNNLEMSFAKRQAFGSGVYFSEFPDTSMSYGDALLLFRVLPGNENIQFGYKKTPEGFHSTKVGGNVEGFGNILIVQDSRQFVPYAVYHFKTSGTFFMF